MTKEWVIDTNVLLVATQAVLGRSPRYLEPSGVPVKELETQELVYKWLETVNNSRETTVVLDRTHGTILREYKNNLHESEYGRMVIVNKISRNECRWVDVEVECVGNKAIGLIPHPDAEQVFDASDRKMVAAAMAARAPIANACDTDWFELKAAGVLEKLGVKVHEVIEEWCEAKWKAKKAR